MTGTGTFLSKVKDLSEVRSGLKVQVWGGTETGKSHDAYLHMPRPAVVVDGDVSGERFQHTLTPDRGAVKHFGPDVIPDLETLVAFLEEFASTPEWYKQYKSLIVDSLTIYTDDKVERLGIDQTSDARDNRGKGQTDYAKITKKLTRLIRKISALGVHVYIIAEERTKYEGSKPVESQDASAKGKSSLSPTKFTFPFDLIIQKSTKDTAVIRKSRFDEFKKDQKITGYDAANVIGKIVEGQIKKVVGLDSFDPECNEQEELMELLKSLGSDQRGGKIPKAEMQQYLLLAKDNSKTPSEFAAAIADVKAKYGEGVAAAPAAATAAA